MATSLLGNSHVPYSEKVVGLVEGKVDEVSTILEDAIENLNYFIDQIQAYLRTDIPLSSLNFTVQNVDLTPVPIPVPPEAPTIDTDIPVSYPATMELEDIDLDIPEFPEIDPTAPNIPEREIPDIDIPEFEGQLPAINTDIPLPTRPGYDLPDVPEISFPSIRAFDGFYLPQLQAECPELLLNEIGAAYTHSSGAYSSDLALKISTWLDNQLTNGGTGLSTEVEQAIWDAAVLRLDEEFAQTYDKELKFFASRGFRLPPGALRGALAEVHRLYSRKTAELNKEIMVKQAELAQTNTHFAMEQSVKYEAMLREFFNQVETRLMESSKNAVTLAVDVYNAKIGLYNASLDAYKTKVGAYEAQIRAVSLLADEYRVEMEAAKLSTDIQMLKVQNYKEQIAAIQMLAQWYESDVKAVGVLMENERNKVEIFKSQVEAYSAQVAANGALVGYYNALAENDKARASVYAEKMRGYGALTDAVKSRITALIAKAELENDIRNKTALELYKANIGKVDSRVQSLVNIEKLKLDKYQHDQSGYQAQVQGFSAHCDVIIREYVAKIQYASSQIELIIKEAELNQNSTIHLNTVKIETLKSLAQVMSQVVASALGAINASMQLGYSGGYNASVGYQGNKHISEVHEYKERCDSSCTGR